MSRTGRRPGAPPTRDVIVTAARRCFGMWGYEATSLRSVAAEARVDPALLIHYFGNKEGLFAAAMALPFRPSELFASLPELTLPEASQTIARLFLQMADSDDSRNAILALVRSAVSNEKAAAIFRGFVTEELLTIVSGLTDRDDARMRASMVAAQLIGVAMLRHVVRVQPLADATQDEIIALIAPVIDQYLR
jgi:AcrR family transcriptional regulator